MLISSPLFKGCSYDAVSYVRGVNIFKDSAHPGVATDVWIGCCWATEGAENVYDGAIATHIGGKVGIDGFSKRH